MQMLLHEHPVNAARERAGRAPVTGVWIWGGGDRRGPRRRRMPRGARHRGARAMSRAASRGARTATPRCRAAGMAALPPAAAVHSVLPPAFGADAVAALDAAWLAPAAAALVRGAITSIALVADSGGPAFQLARRQACVDASVCGTGGRLAPLRGAYGRRRR